MIRLRLAVSVETFSVGGVDLPKWNEREIKLTGIPCLDNIIILRLDKRHDILAS